MAYVADNPAKALEAVDGLLENVDRNYTSQRFDLLKLLEDLEENYRNRRAQIVAAVMVALGTLDAMTARESVALGRSCSGLMTVEQAGGQRALTDRSFLTALRFLRLADTPALVSPLLRRLAPWRWRALLDARDRWLDSLPQAGWEAAISRRLLVLLGSVDAPVSLALQALAIERGLSWAGDNVAMGLDDLELPAGQVVAVDAGASGFPFGGGRLACKGAQAGRAFAEAALEVCRARGVRVHRRRLRRVRRRLAVCIERMICEVQP